LPFLSSLPVIGCLSFAEAERRHDNQKLAAYDEDATLSVSTILALPTCNGRIGATGMCLGGHLAYRCALDRRVAAAVCYFATDIHSHSLGEGMQDDSLERAGVIRGELVMVSTLSLILSRVWVPGKGMDVVS
jgi:dienelactone hydrolase